jgi:hypothetical protein
VLNRIDRTRRSGHPRRGGERGIQPHRLIIVITDTGPPIGWLMRTVMAVDDVRVMFSVGSRDVEMLRRQERQAHHAEDC